MVTTRRTYTRQREHGAALLLAMIVLTLVATVAASMVWQQSRAIHVEAAERARTQAAWMLDSGIDFGRYVVRRFSTTNPTEGAPWDNELQETRLSSLLAADRDNNADANLEAFISGRVEDAQARYNLRNLVFGDDGQLSAEQRKILQALCEVAGAQAMAPVIERALAVPRQALPQGPKLDATSDSQVPFTRIEHLRWLGADEATLQRLMLVMDLLPGKSKVNINTASADVIAAVADLPRGMAARLVRQGGPAAQRFNNLSDAVTAVSLPEKHGLTEANFSHRSELFYIHATVRLEDRALAARALVEQVGTGSQANIRLLRMQRGPVMPGNVAATNGQRQ